LLTVIHNLARIFDNNIWKPGNHDLALWSNFSDAIHGFMVS